LRSLGPPVSGPCRTQCPSATELMETAAHRRLNWRRDDHCGGRFVENGDISFAIEPQTESVLRCKLRNLCLPIFLVQRPKAFQVPLVNRAVPPLAMHPLFDLFRQRFHCFAIQSLQARSMVCKNCHCRGPLRRWLQGRRAGGSYGSLKSPVCSCVSITLPASS